MHEAGVVHQDLKPENLIMNRDGHLKIIDFGRAQRLTFDMVTDPEKSSWWRRLVRSEQLSFGMLLYELATGIGPFKDRETAPALAELLGEQLVPLPTENQLSLEEAVRLCAAEDGSDAGLLLTAMSLALCLAGSSTPSLKV
jgi:serine/threonine-protein kinase